MVFRDLVHRIRPKPTDKTQEDYHGDRPRPRHKGQKVEPRELRELCELIRKRYSLDVEIWSLRKTRLRDRHIVQDKMRKAEATLRKIDRIVDSWDTEDAFSTEQDLEKFRQIKRRIKMGGKRDWENQSPF